MRSRKISLDIFGDRFPWEGGYDYSGGDNHVRYNKMKLALIEAIKNELTDCQREVVEEFYFKGKTVTVIAKEKGVNKSTVSRHLKRARVKLERCLKYGFFPSQLE